MLLSTRPLREVPVSEEPLHDLVPISRRFRHLAHVPFFAERQLQHLDDELVESLRGLLGVELVPYRPHALALVQRVDLGAAVNCAGASHRLRRLREGAPEFVEWQMALLVLAPAATRAWIVSPYLPHAQLFYPLAPLAGVSRIGPSEEEPNAKPLEWTGGPSWTRTTDLTL